MTIENQLFNNAFDVSIWKNQTKIDELKSNLTLIEYTIQNYLKSITDDFPYLTDHSIVHSRMLWNYASIIIGEKKDFINPLEAFVLHTVFLVHDAGMCYSVLNNQNEIEKDPLYTDFIIKNENSPAVKDEALFYTIRQRHGDFALRIATDSLREGEYLISDINLREELGLIIGKIAKSHTCNINYIEREFGPKYSNPNFPTDWSIDCQKLSFILRTADAAHIDNLRTPKTNRMISEIQGISKEHWTFQKKLGFPQLSNDGLLMYSTNTPFSSTEQKAWWFCYEALQVLDKELKNANEYFDVNQLEGFSARGVKSINDTLELGKKYIRTIGWNSIDTQIKVTNPVHIASELGGIKLYGNINIALRELIQNSLDAINLYRIHTGQNNTNVGEIKLSIKKSEDDFYLTITDNGIGMSQTIMTNELLDFGGSYWKSNRFKYDFQGIHTKGFESIGKFGIGFFSTFMLGKKITVTSWKFGEAISNMKTLDFYDGLSSNPILREPTEIEKSLVIDRGTSITIKISENPFSLNGFIGNSQFHENTLFSLVKYFIPSPNVKITIEELDGKINTIKPNAIDDLNFDDFIDYIHIIKESNIDHTGIINLFKTLDLKLFEIKDDFRLYGKLTILPQIGNIGLSSTSVVLSNGIRINEVGSFAGYIITDDVISIKRDSFSKLIPYDVIKKWAEQQRLYIESSPAKNLYTLSHLGLLLTFNFFDDNLPITLTKKNNNYEFFTIRELKQYLKKNSEIKFHHEGHSLSGRLPDCDGFISLNFRFSVKNIVREEDQDKLIEHKEFIEKIIKEEWGEFRVEQDNLIKQVKYNFEMPYMIIEKYIKV
ncbi:hypothetical protein GCM10022386_10160 [Flavobacterium cheonhonense]|uniref:HD-CE domain-containing protein n=1 Tax=Flavobacterium cheonhonense TaxID=706185 RepID=A0ABP7TPA8_9FLAO|nr:ATP-binding protein [Flavobacterium cheonhonense]